MITSYRNEIVQKLLDEGFARPALSKLMGCAVKDIFLVKTGEYPLDDSVWDKLEDLYLWTLILKDDKIFTLTPVPYFEIQMLILHAGQSRYYAYLHHLYEAGTINADEMLTLALQNPCLYDDNAFMEEFPVEYALRDFQEVGFDVKDAVPNAVKNNSIVAESITRHAIENILEAAL